MTWQDIQLSFDRTHFLFNGQNPFGRTYISALKFHAPGLAPVQDEKGWYIINTDGKEPISGPFKKAWGYYCNRCAVEDETGCYHILPDVKAAYSERYAWCGNYQQDLCTVKDSEGNYFHIGLNGQRVYTEKYEYAGDFYDGLACVKVPNGKWKHIRNDGSYLYEYEFEDLGVFHKGYATARDERGWFHIDGKGEALYAERYAAVEPFYNGVARVLGLEGKNISLNLAVTNNIMKEENPDMVEIEKIYKRKIEELWQQALTRRKNGHGKILTEKDPFDIILKRGPLTAKEIRKNSLLFMGLNPSFNESEEVKNHSTPIFEFSNAFNSRQKMYFESFIKLWKDSGFEDAEIPWGHLDALFVRHSKQNIVGMLPNWDLPFVSDQLMIVAEILEAIEPRVIVVANTLTRHFLGFDMEPKGNLSENEVPKSGIWMGYRFKFDDTLGTHRIISRYNDKGQIKTNLTDVPVFFTSMISGQRALDNGSKERLKWHLNFVLKRLK
jgi:WG containing repeat